MRYRPVITRTKNGWQYAISGVILGEAETWAAARHEADWIAYGYNAGLNAYSHHNRH